MSGEQVIHPAGTEGRSADWAEEAVAEAESHEDPELAQYGIGGATLSLEEQVLARIDRQRRRKARIKEERITLAHGAGGKATHTLIDALFLESFRNPVLEAMEDQATLSVGGARLAFTTDSFVVHPLFFPGGNIGDLAVNGTVNDLAVGGARPLYLSAGFILEEGFGVADLQRIVDHQRRRAVGLQADCGLFAFELLQAARHHEGEQHVLQAVHSPLCRSLPRR